MSKPLMKNWTAPDGTEYEVCDAVARTASPDTPTDTKYFDIDYDGIISLKPEFRGCPTATTYPYAVSSSGVGLNGARNSELPEKIVFPDVIDGTAVSGFQPGMFYCNNRVKEIVLPDGVSELPDYFCRQATNLRSIRNTEQITKLGSFVIANTKVTKAIFPNLKEVASGSLGANAFLHTADIGNNLTTLPTNFLAQCGMLSVVKGGANITSIGNTAFQMTRNLKNLPFLSLLKVTSIGQNAFYNSRIQFDWSLLDGKCTFGQRATPVIDNTTDYWSGVNYTPCENRLVTLFSQADPRWKDETFGDSGKTYHTGCAVFSTLHVHSALSGKVYSHPDEFAEELRAIDPSLVSEEKHPTEWLDMVSLLGSLGYTTTVHDTAITATAYQSICDALARGAYVISEVSTANNSNNGHVVVIYGMNSIGEVLVADSNLVGHLANPNDEEIRERLTYRMPHQNLTGASRFVIVEKG